jgi:DNA-binding CsgD family transcriptional regulator
MKTKSTELLSPREKEILALIMAGKSDKEIASELFIANYTVQTHHRNINKKLGARNIAELFRAALGLE